jgi:hypothetical protein
MDKQLFESVVLRSEELKTWEPSNVFLEAEDGSQINLMDYITDGKAERHSWILLKDDASWRDTSSDQTPDSKHRAELVKYINHACKKAGFAITVKGWRDLEGGGVLRLRCSQNRPFKGKAEEAEGDTEKQHRRTKTSKPTCADEACPFIFNMHWFKDFQRWGLKAHSGKRQHCGHVYLEEEHVKCSTSKFLKATEQILLNQANAA